MLEEAAQVLKAMWTEELARFEGEHYRLDGAISRPKSVQRPHPPLWIAGGGERRTLRIVAEHGDHSNFGKSVESFIHKSNVLASHCEDVGRDFDEIGRSVHLMSVIGRNDVVKIRKGPEEKELKFKKAETLIQNEGWELVQK